MINKLNGSERSNISVDRRIALPAKISLRNDVFSGKPEKVATLLYDETKSYKYYGRTPVGKNTLVYEGNLYTSGMSYSVWGPSQFEGVQSIFVDLKFSFVKSKIKESPFYAMGDVDWQPIQTVPKDDNILFYPSNQREGATHWKPFPSAPKL
jgi:hypothetical protein